LTYQNTSGVFCLLRAVLLDEQLWRKSLPDLELEKAKEEIRHGNFWDLLKFHFDCECCQCSKLLGTLPSPSPHFIIFNGLELLKYDFGAGKFFIYIPPKYFSSKDIKALKHLILLKMPKGSSSKQSGNAAPDIDPGRFISTPKKNFYRNLEKIRYIQR